MCERVVTVLAGIFVGGRARRMGGLPKGLLAPPSGEPSIVVRWQRMLDSARVPHILVGRRPEYAHLGELLSDDPVDIGPMGGLRALLLHAERGNVLALGCDMPFVEAPLLRRLLDAPRADATAPRIAGRYEPLFARYDVAGMLPRIDAHLARAERSLQALFDGPHAAELAIDEHDARSLRDWDTRADVEAR